MTTRVDLQITAQDINNMIKMRGCQFIKCHSNIQTVPEIIHDMFKPESIMYNSSWLKVTKIGPCFKKYENNYFFLISCENYMFPNDGRYEFSVNTSPDELLFSYKNEFWHIPAPWDNILVVKAVNPQISLVGIWSLSGYQYDNGDWYAGAHKARKQQYLA